MRYVDSTLRLRLITKDGQRELYSVEAPSHPADDGAGPGLLAVRSRDKPQGRNPRT